MLSVIKLQAIVRQLQQYLDELQNLATENGLRLPKCNIQCVHLLDDYEEF
jgi:hypothetical protein